MSNALGCGMNVTVAPEPRRCSKDISRLPMAPKELGKYLLNVVEHIDNARRPPRRRKVRSIPVTSPVSSMPTSPAYSGGKSKQSKRSMLLPYPIGRR
ncbi:hypothetical protein IG631_14285 [Alternaria alternata]|nr:hypothetical protein IG631_14285 [Alternaria alternata]